MNIVQIYKKFPTQQDCINYLEEVRWGGVPTCPYCLSIKSTPRSGGKRHQCNHCNASYSVTVGTALHKTHMSLHQWFLMMSLMMNAKKSLSARQMGRDIGVTKDTALKNMMKLRESMIENEWMRGVVEVDETLVGGKNKNRHMDKKIPHGQGGHSHDKTAVIGMRERETGRLKAMVIKDRKGATLKPVIYSYVQKGTTVMTDEHTGYSGLSKYYDHKACNHSQGVYVIGDTHTNSIEGEWSLFKRGYMGQWHHISAKNMNLYLEEFSFRANYRYHPDIFGVLLQKSLRV